MNTISFVDLSEGEKETLEVVRQCLIDKTRTIIDYDSESSLDGRRTIVPLSLRKSNAGATLLYGWNVNEGVRAYRVDRIKGSEPTVDPWPENIPDEWMEF